MYIKHETTFNTVPCVVEAQKTGDFDLYSITFRFNPPGYMADMVNVNINNMMKQTETKIEVSQSGGGRLQSYEGKEHERAMHMAAAMTAAAIVACYADTIHIRQLFQQAALDDPKFLFNTLRSLM